MTVPSGAGPDEERRVEPDERSDCEPAGPPDERTDDLAAVRALADARPARALRQRTHGSTLGDLLATFVSFVAWLPA